MERIGETREGLIAYRLRHVQKGRATHRVMTPLELALQRNCASGRGHIMPQLLYVGYRFELASRENAGQNRSAASRGQSHESFAARALQVCLASLVANGVYQHTASAAVLTAAEQFACTREQFAESYPKYQSHWRRAP
jgi:hypothetical protein